MSQWYQVLKADPLGDPYTPNFAGAKATQTYWCQFAGLDKDVSVGKQVRDDGAPALVPGQQLYGDLLYAKSQRGTEYWKFKSQKTPDGERPPAAAPVAQPAQQGATGSPVDMSGAQPAWFTPWGNMITYIYQQMKAMDGDAINDPAPAEPAPQPEQVPLTPEDNAILDEIFNKPIEAPEVPEGK